jgi:long-chain acyl-CoA synthetase
MVVGDRQPYIAALITLDPEALPAWAAAHAGFSRDGTPRRGATGARAHPGCRRRRQRRALRYQQIKRFTILPRDFTMDDDELTPTLKLKRRVVTKHSAGSSTSSTPARR